MKLYYKLIKILKKELPCAYPVQINRLKMTMKNEGDCQLISKKFKIRINKRLTEREAIDTLLHEYAHGRCWSHYHSSLEPDKLYEICHGPEWGIAYAECYRIYEKFLT